MRAPVVTVALFIVVVALPAFDEYPTVEDLVTSLGIRESAIASRYMPGWSRPEKISFVSWGPLPGHGPGSGDWFREVADGVRIDFVDASQEPVDLIRLADSDAYIGWCIARLISGVDNIDYVHLFSAGVDRCVTVPGLVEQKPIVTNSAKAASETIAEHAVALLLALTRNLPVHHAAQLQGRWPDDDDAGLAAVSIQGKTLLVLGLGGIGSQVARRAHALGMRVIGTRNSSRSGPDYVDYVGLSGEMTELATQADVVINALPLTSTTRGIVDGEFFNAMKDGAYYVSVGRGATTDTAALIAALDSGKLHGAGLDVTDPEPLPEGHPLWTMKNVIITPHTSASSERSRRNTRIIARENLRRYIRGEKLLNLVDLQRGY